MKQILLSYKKFTILSFGLLALLFANSCKKELLEPAPLNSISSATAFETPDRIANLLNGLYDAVKSGQFYGGRFVVYGDIRAEEFLNETTNGVTGLQTWNHTLAESTNEVNNLWGAIYYAINSCNIFMDGVEKNKAVLKNDALATQYIAEARFLRALCYHSLLTLYARPFADNNGSKPGVPLRLLPETNSSNNNLARASVADVYTQVLNDLNFAEQNLAASHPSAILNTVRAHKNSAIALKTRVYLAMGRYADVITEANKIVSAAAPFKASSGVAHELQADVTKVFASPYTTTESIFSMPMTSNDLPGTQNGLGSYYNAGPKGIGDFTLNPSGIIGEARFESGDARRAFISVNATNSKPYLAKFPTGPEHLDYVPVIRYAEVLMNLSEAIARTTGLDQKSVDLLNAIRGRANAAGTYTLASFASAQDLISAIMLERRIEFLGEGHRSLDCTRLLAPIPGKANVPTINQDNSDYIWPIPQSELTVNKACEPNP